MNKYARKKCREEKFEELLNRIYVSKKGDRIRQIVKIVAEAYKNKAPELKKYFENENLLVGGIATSAYQLITGDFTFIQSQEFGGLGAIIKNSPAGLKFNQDQLRYSKISGTALRRAKLSDNAGWKIEAYEDALGGVECFDNAMMYSNLHERTGLAAIIRDNAMKYSTLSKDALYKVRRYDDALYGSKIKG